MDPYLGEFRLFAGTFAPTNWAFCNGQLLSVNDYQALYSLLGTLYGGDGQTTFGLPDLRGRAPMHKGSGSGLTPRPIGSAGGSATVALTTAQIPAHSHAFNALTAAANVASPLSAMLGDTTALNFQAYRTPPASPGTMSPAAVGYAGSNLPHNNMMLSIAINYIICTNGIYPSRS